MTAVTAIPNRDTYTCQEIAARLGVPERHVQRMAEQGKLRSVRLGGRVLIPVNAYERWLRGGDRP